MRHPPLDLRELQCVREIAREGSIHAAARTLGAKQSSLSRSLRLLENGVGVRLFRRTSGGTRLTPAGEAFLREAEELLDGATALYERTRRWGRGESGVLSVGVQGGVPPGRVSTMLELYGVEQPDLSFAYRDGGRQDLLQSLREGVIDLAIITLPLAGADIATAPLWSDRVVAIVPAGHPTIRSETASWADLHEAIFVIGNDDTGEEMRGLLSRKTRQAGFIPLMRLEPVRSLRTVALVANGHGIALLPDAWLGFLPVALRERIVLVEVIDGDGFPHLDYGVVWQPKTCPPAARKFLTFLEDRVTAI